jgi:aromatic ring-opening dioxygenase catalytic subunit (LigB family)
MYRLKFKSRGDTALAQRVVEALQKVGFLTAVNCDTD